MKGNLITIPHELVVAVDEHEESVEEGTAATQSEALDGYAPAALDRVEVQGRHPPPVPGAAVEEKSGGQCGGRAEGARDE